MGGGIIVSICQSRQIKRGMGKDQENKILGISII